MLPYILTANWKFYISAMLTTVRPTNNFLERHWILHGYCSEKTIEMEPKEQHDINSKKLQFHFTMNNILVGIFRNCGG